ncbi:MAG: helix-turn-helix domain-containing protein [Leucobacter sp.]
MIAGLALPDPKELAKDVEWLELIDRLRLRKQRMVSDFLSRFDGNVIYGGKVPSEDIDALVGATMEMYFLLLSGQPLPPALQRLPADLGSRRARQGVPAEQLLEGVRTNSRVIWNALREITDPSLAGCLIRNTDVFLGLVEWHVREVQYAYLRQMDTLQRQNETHRRQALRKLFEDPNIGSEEIAVICRQFDIQADDEFELAVQLGAHISECELCSVTGGSFVHEFGRVTCHFRALERDGIEQLRAGGLNAYFSPVRGVQGLRRAAHAGHSLLLMQPSMADGLITPANTWMRVAWRAVEEFYPNELLPVDLDGIRSIGRSTRLRLIETASMFLTTGSIKTTAESLFCHRNTIVKRLAQFEEIVGLRFSIPRECALIVLVLTAFDSEEETDA